MSNLEDDYTLTDKLNKTQNKIEGAEKKQNSNNAIVYSGNNQNVKGVNIKRKGTVETKNNMENSGPKKFEKKQVSHKKAGGIDMSTMLIILVVLFLLYKIYR